MFNILFDYLLNKGLAIGCCRRIVMATVSQIIRKDPDPQKRNTITVCNLSCRGGFHFFGTGTKLGMQPDDTVELVVPEITTGNSAFYYFAALILTFYCMGRRQ